MKLRRIIYHVFNTHIDCTYDMRKFSIENVSSINKVQYSSKSILMGEEEHRWVCNSSIENGCLNGLHVDGYFGYPSYTSRLILEHRIKITKSIKGY